MPRRLLRPSSDGSFAWIELTANGRPGPVRDGLPPRSAADELWLAVPAEEVLLLTVPRPPGSPRQMAQALPYAIEDRLAAPVETQHLAWAFSREPGRLDVAVLDRVRMRHWLDTLAAAGLEPEALVPEPLLLPGTRERPLLLVEGERALLRYGPTQAFCGRPEEIPALGLVDAGRVETVPAGQALARMAEALRGAPPLNLLHGEFEPAARRRRQARPWRLAAALAAAALGLALLHALAERQALAGLVERQREEMAGLYRQAVPGASRVVDAEQQLRAALGGAGGDRALALLARAAPVLAQAAGIELDALEYRDPQLDLVLHVADVAALDALRARLQQAGLRVDLTAATPGSRGIEGRLSLRESGA